MGTLHPPESEGSAVHGPGEGPTAAAVFDALAGAPIGLAVFDRSLRFVHLNAWMADANGLAESAHLGRTLGEVFPTHPEAVALVESRIRSVLATRQPTTFSVAATVASGDRREWVATYFPIVGVSGAVDGACGIVIDVTADRAREAAEARARDEAERAHEEAERARALLDAIVENAPVGIGFFDRDLRYQRVNPKLAEMNGLPIEAHLGKRPRDVLPGLPNDQIEAVWRRVVETGEPIEDVEIAGDTPGAGRRIWLESWYPVRSEGEIVGVGSLVRDVTHEREAEEFQRHVMGIVGHDLRNPLSAIAIATKLLGRAGLPRAPAALVARIAASAARTDEIVRSLLDFARVRSGTGVPLSCRPCDLADIARAVVEECRLAHPGSRIECGGEGDCTGEWDPDRIAQLLTNLVSNALQHGPEGTPISVRWRSTDGEVVVAVANAGPSISADVVPLLFQPFRRGEPSRSGGLGLGLFIAQAIAAAHGGRIDVCSSEPDGTVFSVRLPRRRGAPETAGRT